MRQRDMMRSMSGKCRFHTPHTLDRLVMVENYMQRIYDNEDVKLLSKIYDNNVINWTIYQGLKISSKTLINPNEYEKINVAILRYIHNTKRFLIKQENMK